MQRGLRCVVSSPAFHTSSISFPSHNFASSENHSDISSLRLFFPTLPSPCPPSPFSCISFSTSLVLHLALVLRASTPSTTHPSPRIVILEKVKVLHVGGRRIPIIFWRAVPESRIVRSDGESHEPDRPSAERRGPIYHAKKADECQKRASALPVVSGEPRQESPFFQSASFPNDGHWGESGVLVCVYSSLAVYLYLTSSDDNSFLADSQSTDTEQYGLNS